MLKNNGYNIDREFDYTTVKNIALRSLDKIAKQEALKNIHNGVIFDSKDNNVNKLLAPPTSPSLKLKITQQPKAESDGEEMMGECPTCHGKGEVNKEESS